MYAIRSYYAASSATPRSEVPAVTTRITSYNVCYTKLLRFALAWCLQNPWVNTVITGASRVEQVHENMQALDFVERFTPGVMARIEEILQAPAPPR